MLRTEPRSLDAAAERHIEIGSLGSVPGARGGIMKNYGVLKGRALELKRDDDADPHSEVLILAGGKKSRIAINVRSSRGPQSTPLKEGFTDLRGPQQNARGVDYIRSNLFRAEDLVPIVHTQPGENNDLFEKVEALLERAIERDATIYAYGEKWGPEEHEPDKYFEFVPGSGIHLIHMNQGDSDNPNGKYQDGALFVEFASGETAGLFLKVQSQAWHTDEDTGNPLPDAPSNPPIIPPPEGPVEPWPVLPPDSPYRLARIIGALINPAGSDPGLETVTLFNTSDGVLDLEGWKILDQNDRAESLRGKLPVAEARTFVLDGKGAQLGNKGGTITLLDARGLKVDGVAYTKADATPQGRGIVF
jgi:uncharacterized protein YukJ